ncbi:MAG: hypothetical protein ACRDCY_18270 [Aeromonas veronii]
MNTGNIRLALQQLIGDVQAGVLGKEEILERWDEARGNDQIVATSNDTVVIRTDVTVNGKLIVQHTGSSSEPGVVGA